ncbi:MAG: hypothetical protein AAGB31_13135, partial [Bdellovibrio sp.]
EMSSLNPFLLRKVPLSFKNGVMDLYAEIKGDEGRVQGYVKPLVKDLEVMGNESDFKGLKHLGVELSAGLAKVIFRRGDDKTVATKINFAYDGNHVSWKMAEVLGNALEHGFSQPIEPGIENQFQMKYKTERK